MSVNVPSGYKQTKVGVIPEDWDVVKLGEVATFYKGKGISKKEISIDGIPCIRYGELYTKYNEKIKDIFSKTSIPKEELFLSQVNDILIPASGETAIDLATASCVLSDNIGLGGDINVIRSSLNGVFLSYYLNTIAKIKIASLAQGVSVIHLYSSQLKSLYIANPPRKEQQKIAQILTAWDDSIGKQEALIKAKEELKKGLMQKLLRGEVRLDGFDGEWEEVRFNTVFERVTRKNTVNDTNVLTISAQHGLINQEEFFNKSVASKDLSGYILLKNGEFAYNKSYSNGYPMGATKRLNRYEQGVLSSLYIYFAIKDGDSDFYEHYFEAGFLNKEIYKIAQEGARNHGLLNMSVIEFFHDIHILKPPLEEQQKIAEVLTLADKEIDLLKNEFEALKEQKRGLMQRLLNGVVRVKV